MKTLISFNLILSILCLKDSIKSYLGVNLEGNVDWQVSRYFIDTIKSSRGWGPVSAPWMTDGTIPTDQNGWPTTDAGIVIMSCDGEGNMNCGGKYLLSYEGTADISLFFYGSIEQKVVFNGYTYADIEIPPLPSIILQFTNTINGIRDVKFLRPGYERNTTQLYTNEFLRSLSI